MYIAGTSSSNLYVHLVKSGWGLGGPEGICHWNGACWRWVRKISGKNDFVVDMQLVFDQLLLTTSGGNILRMSFDGSALDYAIPSLAEILWKDDDLFDVSFSSVAFPSKDSAVVVGTKGSLYYYDGSSWCRVQTNTTNTLNDVVGKLPALYVLGDNLIGVFDGYEYRQVLKSEGTVKAWPSSPAMMGSEYRQVLKPEGTLYLNGHCVGPNEVVVGALTSSGPQLVDLCLDSGHTEAVSIPSHVLSVWGSGFDDLYIGTAWSGVLRKVGTDLRVSFSTPYSCRVFRIGDELVTGGILRDTPTVFILRDDQWDPLPIDIDMGYLDP